LAAYVLVQQIYITDSKWLKATVYLQASNDFTAGLHLIVIKLICTLVSL